MKCILATILFVLAASTFVMAQCPEAEKQKLKAWDQAVGNAAERGDFNALRGYYADDYAAFGPAGTMITKAQAIANAEQDFKERSANPQAAPSIKYDLYDITCTPNTAVVAHRTVVTFKGTDGKERQQHSRAIHFLEKRGGNWVMVNTTGHPLNDGGQLIYLQRALIDEMIRNETQLFSQVASDDYISVNPVGMVANKAQAIASAKNYQFQSVDMEDVQVRINGDSGIVTGRAMVKGRIAGGPNSGMDISGPIRFSHVYVKQDGQWRLVAAQLTSITQPSATGAAVRQ